MDSELPESMIAAVLIADGGPECIEIQQVQRPHPAAGEVLVRVQHASLNHLDIWTRRGMPSVPKPRILGADAVGIVAAVGHGVSADLIGSRVLIDPGLSCGRCASCRRGATTLCPSFGVLGEHCDGTHAEFVSVPARNLHAVPDHLDGPAAAALALTWGTAWRMTMVRAAVRPGETVLVWAGSSGVGAAAISLMSAIGVRVITTTRSADKLERLQALGATETLVGTPESLVDDIRRLCPPEGIHAVIDHLGDASWAPSLSLLCKGGRLVTCGATTGPRPAALLTRIFWKQLSILGSTMADSGDVADMLRFVSTRKLSPAVDRQFALRDAAEAHSWLESAAQVGKVVLTA